MVSVNMGQNYDCNSPGLHGVRTRFSNLLVQPVVTTPSLIFDDHFLLKPTSSLGCTAFLPTIDI